MFLLFLERIPKLSGAMHELRVRADGPMSGHAGGGGRAQRGDGGERQPRPARPPQDGHRVRGEKGEESESELLLR